MLALLAPRPGERILDLGCGTGHLTAAIAAAGAEVQGLDFDPAMIEAARAAYPHIRFEQGDAQDFTLDAPVDAVFSNAALHWMTRPADVVACVARALRPGGRFVAEMGGSGNVGRVDSALRAALVAEGIPAEQHPRPRYYPMPDEYRALLSAQGLAVRFMRLFPRYTPLEGGEDGLRGWLRMFDPMFLELVPPERLEAVFQRVEAATRRVLYRNGQWYADYKRLRFMAVKTGS